MKKIYQEDIEKISLKVIDELCKASYIDLQKEDDAFEIVHEVIDNFFENPDYRNYN